MTTELKQKGEELKQKDEVIAEQKKGRDRTEHKLGEQTKQVKVAQRECRLMRGELDKAMERITRLQRELTEAKTGNDVKDATIAGLLRNNELLSRSHDELSRSFGELTHGHKRARSEA